MRELHLVTVVAAAYKLEIAEGAVEEWEAVSSPSHPPGIQKGKSIYQLSLGKLRDGYQQCKRALLSLQHFSFLQANYYSLASLCEDCGL